MELDDVYDLSDDVLDALNDRLEERKTERERESEIEEQENYKRAYCCSNPDCGIYLTARERNKQKRCDRCNTRFEKIY